MTIFFRRGPVQIMARSIGHEAEWKFIETQENTYSRFVCATAQGTFRFPVSVSRCFSPLSLQTTSAVHSLFVSVSPHHLPSSPLSLQTISAAGFLVVSVSPHHLPPSPLSLQTISGAGFLLVSVRPLPRSSPFSLKTVFVVRYLLVSSPLFSIVSSNHLCCSLSSSLYHPPFTERLFLFSNLRVTLLFSERGVLPIPAQLYLFDR